MSAVKTALLASELIWLVGHLHKTLLRHFRQLAQRGWRFNAGICMKRTKSREPIAGREE
jgi:hypothetical protein